MSHPAAIIAKTAQIGSGTFLAAQSVIAPDAKIGNHALLIMLQWWIMIVWWGITRILHPILV